MDLQIYSSKYLESFFIEKVNHKSKNPLVGVIYKHPPLDKHSFNEDYLKPLLENLFNKNNKNICITSDFNMNLLNVENDNHVFNFLEIMTSNFLLPFISLPTWSDSILETIIDNIVTNSINLDINSGNLNIGISDHLPSFTITPNSNQKQPT